LCAFCTRKSPGAAPSSRARFRSPGLGGASGVPPVFLSFFSPPVRGTAARTRPPRHWIAASPPPSPPFLFFPAQWTRTKPTPPIWSGALYPFPFPSFSAKKSKDPGALFTLPHPFETPRSLSPFKGQQGVPHLVLPLLSPFFSSCGKQPCCPDRFVGCFFGGATSRRQKKNAAFIPVFLPPFSLFFAQ